MRSLPDLAVYFDLWGRPIESKLGTEHGRLVRAVLQDLKNGKVVTRKHLLQTSYTLLRLAPNRGLKEMQANLESFSSAVPPQYMDMLTKIRFSGARKDELVLNACNPDIYTWRPANSITREAIVCFCTSKNTLNMPRPIAHQILSKLGVGLIYVGNRPTQNPSNGLIHHSLEESAELIKGAAKAHGFTNLHGLGASLGGYLACLYAPYLDLQRVLNFSGYPNQHNDQMPVGTFDSEKIMTVLSRTGATDKKILANYRRDRFITPIEWVESESHGSFSTAFIEGRLDNVLAWLLGKN